MIYLIGPMMWLILIIVMAFLIGYGCRAIGLTVRREDDR